MKGDRIVMDVMRVFGLRRFSWVVIGLLASPAVLSAATIVVDSSADSVTVDGQCTLREAILAANSNTGGDCTAGDAAPVRDVIEFAIPGPGVHTFSPATNLPPLMELATIDGYSQPGASPNTQQAGIDAVLLIEIDGSGTVEVGQTAGLRLLASDCEVRGVVINNFFNGILVDFVDGGVVAGNFLGTDASGTVAEPNQRSVWLRGTGGRVGGYSLADRNLMVGDAAGIVLSGSGHGVHLNYIGVDATGTVALGGGQMRGVWIEGTAMTVGDPEGFNLISGSDIGVYLTSGSGALVAGNLIGTDPTGLAGVPNRIGVWASAIPSISSSSSHIGAFRNGNRIAFNLEDGVQVGPPCSQCPTPQRGISIRANSISDNGGLGIDLVGLDGVDEVAGNDAGDLDSGVNDLQNRPTLLAASDDGTNLEVAWRLDSTPSSTFVVDFFANLECDDSGSGEGQVYLDSVDVVTDAFGVVQTTTSLNSLPQSVFLTATATDDTTDNTSEFSLCLPVERGLEEIPTLSTWGILSLLLLLALAGRRLVARQAG